MTGQAWSVPQSRNQGEVQVEDILQPFNCSGGLVGENLDQIWASLVPGGFEGVIVELLDAVANLLVDLGSREGSVDA